MRTLKTNLIFFEIISGLKVNFRNFFTCWYQFGEFLIGVSGCCVELQDWCYSFCLPQFAYCRRSSSLIFLATVGKVNTYQCIVGLF